MSRGPVHCRRGLRSLAGCAVSVVRPPETRPARPPLPSRPYRVQMAHSRLSAAATLFNLAKAGGQQRRQPRSDRPTLVTRLGSPGRPLGRRGRTESPARPRRRGESHFGPHRKCLTPSLRSPTLERANLVVVCARCHREPAPHAGRRAVHTSRSCRCEAGEPPGSRRPVGRGRRGAGAIRPGSETTRRSSDHVGHAGGESGAPDQTGV